MRAPAGGTISIINDKHYVGGQFLPEHGLFCGKSGAKRKALLDRVSTKVDLGGNSLYEVYVKGISGGSVLLGLAIADSREQAAAAFQAGRKRKVEAWKR